jgi:serine/threonine-protein kinase HipA
MRAARIFVNNIEAGTLTELEYSKQYCFEYLPTYSGAPISLTMPVLQRVYQYANFPPFFDGLLPEGYQLEGLLKIRKLDRNDFFGQLLAVGDDLVGNVSVNEIVL